MRVNLTLKVMKRSIIIAILLFLNLSGIAQNSSDFSIRKMETIGYAATTVSPNVIYTSFVIKDYKENGKVVTIKETENYIRKIIKKLGCNAEDFSVGNIYGYISYNGPNNDEGSFEHRRLYLLKLSSVECIDTFLDKVDPRALESFNIDEMDNNDIDGTLREIQLKAFAKAKDKATVLLATYGETCGKVLDVQEINRNIIYPDMNGKGGRIQAVNQSGMNNYDYNQIRTKSIKVEYEVKIIFEIK